MKSRLFYVLCGTKVLTIKKNQSYEYIRRLETIVVKNIRIDTNFLELKFQGNQKRNLFETSLYFKGQNFVCWRYDGYHKAIKSHWNVVDKIREIDIDPNITANELRKLLIDSIKN